MTKARKIVERNQELVRQYETYKEMALKEGDIKYAKICDNHIAQLKGGIQRWQ